VRREPGNITGENSIQIACAIAEAKATMHLGSPKARPQPARGGRTCLGARGEIDFLDPLQA